MVSRLAGTGIMQGTANSIMRREGQGGLIEAGELWTKSPSALDLFLTFKHEAGRGSVRRIPYVSQPILEKNISEGSSQKRRAGLRLGRRNGTLSSHHRPELD
ncbi:hypothetical protein I316_00650 [Kwoniella heveanensis BCC8398]|uniref:Uncharacterized protein n=1 Tax=Kwoniella heveanensis BCC8398 TaxID=1296120 RepID=A0A1B9H2M3_9TREE|nr:hypothetical protein I316_00650 [Kwoniella heveanensis BCC8398]